VHEVCVDAFWIDVTEVTNAQYGEQGFYSQPDQPYVGVSWFDAVAFCESRGGRLPTEAEWAFAGRGPESLVYPWGDEFDAESVLYTGNSNFGPARVGTRPGGASWVGALDMSGNVWEWVADWYADSYYADSKQNPLGPTFGTQRVFRGGSWDNFDTDVRLAERFSHNPETATATTLGFRCVKDAGAG
jgi:formylglycine-generating enzyme required for sulfatase activity